ncbi:pilus assembly protein TadG-related protein [Streptomyces sp. ET3-23]|uniref:TadE/TadG family type IV pilus assembly protein n=1 Tax=Streptomyces sp. ET3-23 TaxID=2885643 RepID=UPI001D0FC6E7|nr:Tad domain-containing protein [Streptomyces sp. ET3-23]MCC2280841.1 pilus assembly protein TadG-related protein [Streptomyces sp. ET3-23]
MTWWHSWYTRRRQHSDDRGSVAVYTAVCTLALLGIIGLVLDGGGKLRATERADALASEAARAGGQAIDPAKAITGTTITADPQAAQAAAQAYLAHSSTPGSVNLSSDGKTLTVTTHTRYTTTFLPVLGITSLPVDGHGQATLLHGVATPEEGP